MTDDEFVRVAEGYRRELVAHCYRMLGSLSDAEDMVQETYLNAWRSYRDFEGRSSVRTWLYRIATRVCLKALERDQRRPLPSGLAGGEPGPQMVGWLEPIPDASYVPESGDPARVVEARHSTRLALVAALQHLPARSRAVLLLREVLNFHAAEAAQMLDSTPAAVNSALQRARAQLAAAAPDEESTAEPTEPGMKNLLDRYATAFERSDVDTLARLLAEDIRFEMPPEPEWFRGRASAARFLRARLPSQPGNTRMVSTRANGQPAFAMYRRGADGRLHALQVQVLTATPIEVRSVVAFCDPSLFAAFGLPSTVD